MALNSSDLSALLELFLAGMTAGGAAMALPYLFGFVISMFYRIASR
jgi:hypothetical protein